MFDGVSAGVQNALVELVEDGDEAWYSGYFRHVLVQGGS